jgi:hypothetical protein
MWRVLPYRIFFSCILPVLAVVALPSLAAAQGPGVRAGASVDPDQFYLGGHYESNALVDRLHFKPNAEIGFGDDITTFALNFEFVYKMPVSGPWTLYAGGGPAVNIYSFDDDSDAEGGLNFLFGAETARGLFFEVKLGAIDSPDFKFGVGYTWR